jgi:Cdc6-like AAA superfamily ATPase
MLLTQAVDEESDEEDEDDGMGFDESDYDGNTTASDDDDVSAVDNKESLEARAKSLFERREKSQQRHQDCLLQLGLLAPSTSTQELDLTDPTTTPEPAITPKLQQKLPQSPRGMLFKTPYNHQNSQSNGEEDEISLLQHLEQSYPCRQSQIRQLWSLLSPALMSNRQRATTASHIPPPIFVTGPEATGKTTITRDLVSGLKRIRNNMEHNAPARVGCAYVNCATTSSIDGMLHDAYRQLAIDLKLGRHDPHHETPRRKRKRAKPQHSNAPPIMEGFFARAVKQAKNAKKQRVQVDDDDTAKAFKASDGGEASSLQALTTKDEEAENQTKNDKPRRSSRVRQELAEGLVPGINQKAKNAKAKGAVLKEASLDIKATASPSADLQGGEANAVARTSQVTVATFGQEVKQSLFKHHDDCAFFILDQAERLLSLSTTSTSKPNFLAQLLLIPQTKGLNLTIIVISKSTVLEHFRKFCESLDARKVSSPPLDLILMLTLFLDTGFNNSFSTLSSAILPLKVHFHAYKGKEAFRQVSYMLPDIPRKIARGCI